MKCLWLECQYENSDSDEFYNHVVKHTDEFSDDYRCKWEECARYDIAQISKYALQAHLRRHSGDRPYKCELCSKSYTRSDALKKHVKKHELFTKENEELLAKVSTLNFIVKRYEFEIKEEKNLRNIIINNINTITDEISNQLFKIPKQNKKRNWNDYLDN